MENRYGMSPWLMLDMVGPALVIVPFLVYLLFVGPVFIYPLARWKANRDGRLDPQLGLKVALHYFRLVAFQVLLLGAMIVAWTIIAKGGGKSEQYRMGFGFVVPGAIVFGAHVALLARTNDAQYPGVRRLFLGYNVLVTGLAAFVALVAGFQALFARGSSGNEGRLLFAAVVVYGGAWAACGIQLARLVFGDATPSEPPDHVVPPAATTSQPPQASGASLPSLGGGAYPPIADR